MSGCGTGLSAQHGGARATPSQVPTLSPALILDLAQADAACPVDIAWSPDGARLAVLATRKTCEQPATPKPPDVVLIYDAHSGRVLDTLDMVQPLTSAGVTYAYPYSRALWLDGWSGMSWSPNGTTLAVPMLTLSHATGGTFDGAGVILLPVSGDASRMVTGPLSFSASPDGRTPGHVTGANVWSLAKDAPVQTIPLPLPDAAQYRWTADGRIIPDRAAPDSTAAGSFTGSPVAHAGSATFSLWQPGVLASVPVNSTGNARVPTWEFFETSSTLWSPDGQYLATGVSTLSLVGATNGAPPVNQPESCLGEQLVLPCPSTMWPAPDAAFAAAAARGAGRLPLAWRPDGKILAAAWPGDEFDQTNLTLRVSLLSTATGQAVAKATAPAEVHGFFGYPNLLSRPYFSWAPDGTQLAYNDGMDNRIYIWNTSARLANLAG